MSGKNLKNYTIVLMRPDYIADPYGTDVYVFMGQAESEKDAVRRARQEVFVADTQDGNEPRDPDDYALVVGFHGLHKPTLFNWSL